MANEIQTATTLSASKNGATVNPGAHTKNTTMAGEDMLQTTITSITASATAFTWGAITGAPRFVEIKNNDATNYVEIGGDSGLTVFKIRLLAGDSCLIPNPQYSSSLYHKANAFSCQLIVTAVEA